MDFPAEYYLVHDISFTFDYFSSPYQTLTDLVIFYSLLICFCIIRID